MTSRSHRRLRSRDLALYRFCDVLSGCLIYAMVLFSPWAFGTSQDWAVRVMSGAGCGLGLLLAGKLSIRRFKGYAPPRWNSGPSRLTPMLAWLTLCIVLFCLVSAVNARSVYHPLQGRFEELKHWSWLPASFDRDRSWFYFWAYLGLAGAFWGIRDWLLGKTDAEQRLAAAGADSEALHGGAFGGAPFPSRLHGLMWLLCVNGLLLAGEGIVQRLENSGKLLFLVKPRVNPAAVTQFGPWAYRANASQYFNLLWPVCLGFWWTLQQYGRGFKPSGFILLFSVALMAACPTISTSRAGALVTGGLGAALMIYAMILGARAGGRRGGASGAGLSSVLTVGLVFAVALMLALGLGWKQLAPRMQTRTLQSNYDYRDQMYERAKPMAADHPWYGTGPGSFNHVFGNLYRTSANVYWPAQLHNDWLETRITFGWVGFTLIMLALGTALAQWFRPGGMPGPKQFIVCLWMAVAGVLLHARYDFPFQMHSVVFLFLLICAILSISSHPARAASGAPRR